MRVIGLKNKFKMLMNRYFTGNSMNYRQIIAIIIPILVDQAFLIILSLLNTAMISSSGVSAVSAVNMVDSVNIFLVNVFIAVATGGTVMVAQYKGVNDREKLSESAVQSVSAVILLSSFVSVLMIVFHTPVIYLLFGKAEAAVVHNARIYMIGSCISYPFIATVEAVCGALRGVSESRNSLRLSLVTNGSYVLFNVLFIFILRMGVLGMAISVVTSRLLGALCSLIYISKFNKTIDFKLIGMLHIHFKILSKILFIGIPFAMEQMFFNGGKILTQTFIVQLGTLSMAVNAICSSMTLLFQIGANACSLTVVTVVGQCMGRRDIEDAKKFIKSFLGLASVSFIVMACLLLPLFPWIVRLFSPPDKIISVIFKIVLMTGLFQPLFWPVSFITPAALRAAGDSKFTSVASFLSMWLFRVILGYVLGIYLHFGIVGVWAAMIAEWGVRGVIFLYRFCGERWYSHILIS